MLQPQSRAFTRTEQVMQALRARIAAQRLTPGARLPSIRRMAEQMGVSKSTVVEAYERLVGEGAVAARPGSGFYVNGGAEPQADSAAAVRDRAVDTYWMMHQSLAVRPDLLQPGCGWLPDDWLPAPALRRHLRALARDDATDLVRYGPPAGFLALRRTLARRLAASGIDAGPDDILLTDSTMSAIDLACRLLLRPGDTVMIDDPCFYNFRSVLAVHGAQVATVPYTAAGPDLAACEAVAAAAAPRLDITNAGLHNPTGACLAPSTAHRLLKLADRFDFTIVEDDIFADFLPAAQPGLAALDGLERVIHVGGFSKTLSAATRCGFLAARPDRIAALTDLKLATSMGNNDLAARLVHALLVDGSYRRHVDAIRARLAASRGRVLARLRALGLQPWLEPEAGLFLWLSLPDGLDAEAVARRALAQGVVLAPGSVFSHGGGAAGFLRFNVGQCGDPRVFDVLAAAMAG
ncbi:MAG: PLP-dependent aminotransferase family protein [Alphaproteobacteria bacterium]